MRAACPRRRRAAGRRASPSIPPSTSPSANLHGQGFAAQRGRSGRHGPEHDRGLRLQLHERHSPSARAAIPRPHPRDTGERPQPAQPRLERHHRRHRRRRLPGPRPVRRLPPARGRRGRRRRSHDLGRHLRLHEHPGEPRRQGARAGPGLRVREQRDAPHRDQPRDRPPGLQQQQQRHPDRGQPPRGRPRRLGGLRGHADRDRAGPHRHRELHARPLRRGRPVGERPPAQPDGGHDARRGRECASGPERPQPHPARRRGQHAEPRPHPLPRARPQRLEHAAIRRRRPWAHGRARAALRRLPGAAGGRDRLRPRERAAGGADGRGRTPPGGRDERPQLLHDPRPRQHAPLPLRSFRGPRMPRRQLRRRVHAPARQDRERDPGARRRRRGAHGAREQRDDRHPGPRGRPQRQEGAGHVRVRRHGHDRDGCDQGRPDLQAGEGGHGGGPTRS